MYCLSTKNKSHNIQLKIENGKYVQIDILYEPDEWTAHKFTLTIPAKEMSEVDLLKLRLKEAEDKIKELERVTSQTKWKKAVSQNPQATTDSTTHNANKQLVSIILPQKAGKYLCSFSFWVTNTSNTWCYYWIKKGSAQIDGKGNSGCRVPSYSTGGASIDYFNVSGMVIAELNGNENDENRTIKVCATGHGTHKAIFRNCVLVCEELDD